MDFGSIIESIMGALSGVLPEEVMNFIAGLLEKLPF